MGLSNECLSSAHTWGWTTEAIFEKGAMICIYDIEFALCYQQSQCAVANRACHEYLVTWPGTVPAQVLSGGDFANCR